MPIPAPPVRISLPGVGLIWVSFASSISSAHACCDAMSLTLDLSRLTNEEMLKHADACADLARERDDYPSIAALEAALHELCRREALLS